MRRKFLSTIIVAVFAAGVAAGVVLSPHVMAAAAEYEKDVGGGAPTKVLIDNDRLRVTLVTFPKGFTRPGGVKRRADTLIAYIEPGDFKTGGAGAGGGQRPGGARAGAAPVNRPGEPVTCDAVKDCGPVGPDGNFESQSAQGKPLAPGSVAYHPKGSNVGSLEINSTYRALYIELK
jgi:hypothetical protein